MNRNAKKLAFATLAVALTAASLATPAEARRYKHKVMRSPAMAAVNPADHLGAGNLFAPVMGAAAMQAPQQRYAGNAGPRRAERYTAPRLSRAARAAYAAVPPVSSMPATGFGGGGLVAHARQYVGTNPTGMGALWCARFMNMVLERSGHRGTGSNMASSFASYGTRVSGPQVGAIAVMSRGKRGGHVGIVSGLDASGNPIVISGNYNRRVAETVIPRGRIYAYVMP
jgi:uncharacterized protein (TIGR02594 family)